MAATTSRVAATVILASMTTTSCSPTKKPVLSMAPPVTR
jgi:hypothetical protein